MFSNGNRTGQDASHHSPILDPLTPLSEAIARYLLAREQDGLRLSTLALYRQAAWSLVEFLAQDSPIGELPADTPAKWLEWLRTTPWCSRKRGAYPAQFTPGSVSAFLTWPPAKTSSGELRNEQTIGRFWRHGRAVLESLGLRISLPKRSRPKLRLPPPMVSTRRTIAERWREVLSSHASPEDRRRVVLTQALVLSTGMRIEEALCAQREMIEGHWLLITDSKTRQPRIVYLNSQALALIEALKGQTAFPWASDRWQRISGWPFSKGRWHRLVRSCGLHGKTHQDLRKRISTWLHKKDPVAESAQLGHGSGVVFAHYLDTLRTLPRLLERWRLPEVDGFAWPAPIEASRSLPARLYEEFRRIVSRGP